ncbi:hypothetical protein CCMSSC00406_0008026 [Pleurotus cornucopiae]|uniref:Uncharacterized protein n=1 Tax=Pleurotus cornucopiae TaxID=5321 RepID=A0ACB7IW17_PLECO|nr:hypothetical protein CCMSSC00406_0008026 [Pleurotus cornucopiae]
MHAPININTMVEALAALGFTPQGLATASSAGSTASVAAAAAPATASAPAATPAPAETHGDAASTLFQCPSCLAVHSVTPIISDISDGESPHPDAGEPTELGAAPAPALVLISVVPQTDANAPPMPGVVLMAPIAAGADAGSLASPWYAVTTGLQVGVFSDWNNVVHPLVKGVPNWRCKRFTTFELARRSFNLELTRGGVRIYADPATLLA